PGVYRGALPDPAGPILEAMARGQVAIDSVAAPWGPIRLAASSRGLVAVDQLTSAEEFAARLEARFGGPPVERTFAEVDPAAARLLGRARRAIEAFVDGDLNALDDLPVDIEDRPAWDRLVLDAIRTIQPGTTASYGEVA